MGPGGGRSLAVVDVGRRGQEGVGAPVLGERAHGAAVHGQLRLLAEEGLVRVTIGLLACL